MDLIITVKPNEIRLFSGTTAENISPFFIGGEDIYEYEDNDFADDLKEKILTILNEKNFDDIAVHIAYTANSESTVECIIQKFIPCRQIQAVCFDNISDPCETAKQIQTISQNKTAAYSSKLAQADDKIKKQTQKINAMQEKVDTLSAENDSIKKELTALQKSYKYLNTKNKSLTKDNQRMSEICEKVEKYFAPQRCRCYFTCSENCSFLVNIDYALKSGQVFQGDLMHSSVELGKCTIVDKTSNNLPGHFDNISYNRYRFKIEFSYISVTNNSFDIICEYEYRSYGNSNYQPKKIIIIKEKNISKNETFAVLTHPDDTEEAVLKWLKETSKKDTLSKNDTSDINMANEIGLLAQIVRKQIVDNK